MLLNYQITQIMTAGPGRCFTLLHNFFFAKLYSGWYQIIAAHWHLGNNLQIWRHNMDGLPSVIFNWDSLILTIVVWMKMDFLVEQKSAIENFTLFFNDEKLARFYQFFQLRFVADSHLVTWQQSSYKFLFSSLTWCWIMRNSVFILFHLNKKVTFNNNDNKKCKK